jgi:hypothetical protein
VPIHRSCFFILSIEGSFVYRARLSPASVTHQPPIKKRSCRHPVGTKRGESRGAAAYRTFPSLSQPARPPPFLRVDRSMTRAKARSLKIVSSADFAVKILLAEPLPDGPAL